MSLLDCARKTGYLFFSALLMTCLPVQAYSLECLVVSVADGDTLKARCGRKNVVRVRLSDIDAPEMNQPFGMRSKRSLSAMCSARWAQFHVQGKDRYGRLVARVFCDGVDVNAEQVRRGMAWVYRQYSRDAGLLRLEDDARWARRGLWADGASVPPWGFRRERRWEYHR